MEIIIDSTSIRVYGDLGLYKLDELKKIFPNHKIYSCVIPKDLFKYPGSPEEAFKNCTLNEK